MDAPARKEAITKYKIVLFPPCVTYISFVTEGGIFMADNVQHSGFTSRAYGKNRRKYTVRYFSRQYRKRPAYRKDNGGSMLAKMGICVMLAGLVLLSEFAGSSGIVIETSSDMGRNTNDIGGEYLGKLRFVELPGIMQVFSSDARLRMGVEYTTHRLNDEKTVITVGGIDSKPLPAPADGIIKTLAKLEEGTRLELSIDGDMVISFTAKGETAVEEGQPIKAGDTLFKAVESVDIGITKGGRPVNPTEYYDIGNELLS